MVPPAMNCCKHVTNTGGQDPNAHEDIQMQVVGSDCGLFALAFITAVHDSQNPTSLYFDKHKMRRHLSECLEKKMPRPFPTVKQRKR